MHDRTIGTGHGECTAAVRRSAVGGRELAGSGDA
jgi:hypothetical protein